MGVDRYWRCYVSPAFVALHRRGRPGVRLAARGLAPRARSPWPGGRAACSAASGTVLAPARRSLDPARPRREQVRLNLAMDCEINDDLLSSLRRSSRPPRTRRHSRRGCPEDAVTPASAAHRAGANCSSSTSGRYRRRRWRGGWPGWTAVRGPTAAGRDWELGEEGAHPLEPSMRPPRSASGSARRSAAAGGRCPAGWRRWAEGDSRALGGLARPARRRVPRVPASPRARERATTPTGARAVAPRRSAARSCCPASAARCRRWQWSSTPRGR